MTLPETCLSTARHTLPLSRSRDSGATEARSKTATRNLPCLRASNRGSIGSQRILRQAGCPTNSLHLKRILHRHCAQVVGRLLRTGEPIGIASRLGQDDGSAVEVLALARPDERLPDGGDVVLLIEARIDVR